MPFHSLRTMLSVIPQVDKHVLLRTEGFLCFTAGVASPLLWRPRIHVSDLLARISGNDCYKRFIYFCFVEDRHGHFTLSMQSVWIMHNRHVLVKKKITFSFIAIVQCSQRVQTMGGHNFSMTGPLCLLAAQVGQKMRTSVYY